MADFIPPSYQAPRSHTHVFILTAGVVVGIAIVLGGLYAFHAFMATKTSPVTEVIAPIKALQGIIRESSASELTLETRGVGGAESTYTVLYTSSTTITKDGAKKDESTYDIQTKDYLATVHKSEEGDASATSYIQTHPYPSRYATLTVDSDELTAGTRAVILTTTDVRNATTVTADEIRVQNTETEPVAIAPTPSVPHTVGSTLLSLPRVLTANVLLAVRDADAPGEDFDGGGNYGDTGASAPSTGSPSGSGPQHTGNLYWSGNWDSNQFWCDSGYALQSFHYDERSSNNATWFTCVGNNLPATVAPVAPVTPGAPSTPLNASCSVSPSSASTNQTVTWYSSGSGGVAPYSYYWTGSGVQGATTQNTNASYAVAATQTATITITDGQGTQASQSCSVVVSAPYTPPATPLTVGCSGTPNPGQTNQPITWSSSVGGGTAPYSYLWNGNGVGGGTFRSPTAVANYANPATKSVTVTVTDSAGTQVTAGCSDVISTSPPANDPPRGYLDGSSNNGCTINGWAQDTNTPDQPIQTHLYFNGPAGQGTGYATTAGNYRADLCSAIGSCYHGYSYDVPAQFRDNQPHPVYAYGIDSAGGPNTLLGNSPLTFTCAPSLPDLTAYVGAPSTVTSGSAFTLVGGISNTGTGDAGYFPNVLQICDGNCATYNHVTAANAIASLGAGASQAVGGADTAPSSGNYYYRFCANNNGSANVITESNYGNNCSSWQNLTVSQASAPDITAYSGSPQSVAIGSSVSLSATVANVGNGTASAFPNVVQICDGNCVHTSYLNATLVSGLAPNGSQTVSATYAPTSADAANQPLYYRICANMNTAGSNVIGESNYGNNCGPFTNLGVTNPPPPTPMCSMFSGTPATVPAGGTVTLKWICSNVSSCTGSGFSTSGATSGATTVTPSSGTNSYGLQCTGQYGTINATPVTVQAGCSGTPTPTISVAPARVKSGGTTTITAGGSAVNGSCVVTKNGTPLSTFAANSCTVAPQTVSDTVVTTSKYCVACDGGTPICKTVAVIPNFQEF